MRTYKPLSRRLYRPTAKVSTILLLAVLNQVLRKFEIWLDIRKTCTCNVYPIKPNFPIVKLGYAGVLQFFLVLLQNIDCGYSLKLPRRGRSNVYPQSVLSKNKKYIKFFLLKIFNFYNSEKKSVYHMGMFL